MKKFVGLVLSGAAVGAYSAPQTFELN